MGKTTKKLFANGNLKLDKSVGVFSLPPVKTCVNCKTCAKTCYAMQAYKQYTNTRNAWDYNFKLSKTHEFYNETMKQIKTSKKDIFRLHSSGDFYNDEYIEKWHDIIKNNPDKQFYTYTKNKKALVLNDLPNCNVIYSFINGYRNYGSEEYCQLLHDKFNAYVCNIDKNKHEKCMKDCKACLTCDKVAIVIHGSQAKKDDYESKVIEELKQLPDYEG